MDRLNIKDLEYFMELCEHKSLAEAAQALYMTPQGLSKLVKKLESEFKTTLMTRTSSGIQLTETGQYLHDRLSHVLSGFEQLRQDIQRMEHDRQHHIDLLSSYGCWRFLGPECLSAFEQRHPNIKLSYSEFPDQEIERRWYNGFGDVAFVLGNSLKHFPGAVPLQRFPLKLMVNRLNPLSEKSAVSLRELKDQPLYIQSAKFNIHHYILDKFAELGIEPNIVFAAHDFSLCRKMVADNKGIYITADVVYAPAIRENIVTLPFEDEELYCESGMLIRRGSAIDHDLELFRRHIKDWLNTAK